MSQINTLSVYYQNVRGLRSKTNVFFRNIMLVEFDVVCLTETWLLPGIYDSELFDSRYNVYRCDRDYESRGNRFGGGVLIAVRRELSVRSYNRFSMPNAAAEVIEVTLNCNLRSGTRLIRIYNAYFPHYHSHAECLGFFFDILSDTHLSNPDDYYVITGDFNISSAQ